jgi:predicted ATP-grasp superfamily ATP-dependent carboligase
VRALVVSDGRATHVLPAARSLHRAGWSVGLGQPAPGPATASRACAAWHRVPPAEHDVGRFLSAVADAVRSGGYDVVFPGDDIEVLALSAGREVIPAVVPYAGHDVVLRALDKLTLAEAAREAGLATPRTVPESAALLDGPVVVKPRLHWTPGEAAPARHLPVRVTRSRDQMVRAVRAVRAGGGVPVLQELVEGRLMALSVVCDQEGRLRAVSQQETERMSLRGTSSRARTVPVDDDLAARVQAMLQGVGWTGLANLQFLRPADGVPRLIDLNPRYYGSLALAVAAGADLPRIWADLAVGRDPGPAVRGRPGVRFSALDEDLRRAQHDRAIPALLGAARYTLGAAHSTWSASDPGPAVGLLRARAARGGRAPRASGA